MPRALCHCLCPGGSRHWFAEQGAKGQGPKSQRRYGTWRCDTEWHWTGTRPRLPAAPCRSEVPSSFIPLD
eukprot:15463719-Alexandrium_andersonii.AAC.1